MTQPQSADVAGSGCNSAVHSGGPAHTVLWWKWRTFTYSQLFTHSRTAGGDFQFMTTLISFKTTYSGIQHDIYYKL